MPDSIVKSIVKSMVFAITVSVFACSGDSDGEDVDVPVCTTTLDKRFTHNYLIGNTTLRADDIRISANNVTFHDGAPIVYLGADEAEQGVEQFTTIELEWLERDVQMRMYIYFETDGTDWWSDEIRTYDGRVDSDWIYYTGEFFRCPVGQYFSGDITLTGESEDDAIPGELSFDNLWLRAFVYDEALGAQPTELEALVRPICGHYVSCDFYTYPNNCIHESMTLAQGIRPDTYADVSQCISGLAGCGDDIVQCWQDARPQPLPYHDAFAQACSSKSMECTGVASESCNAMSFFTDLPYYSEALVSELGACVSADLDCGDFDLSACMEMVGSRYRIEF